jgi:hypothetical protein
MRGGRRGSGAGPASRGVVSVRTGARRSLNGLMRRLGRYLAEGIDEREALDDLTELFVEEGGRGLAGLRWPRGTRPLAAALRRAQGVYRSPAAPATGRERHAGGADPGGTCGTGGRARLAQARLGPPGAAMRGSRPCRRRSSARRRR